VSLPFLGRSLGLALACIAAISGSAGGQTASVSLTIGTAREQLELTPSIKPLPVASPTAGDRAAL
jgi:hypothetical protein